MENSRLSKNYYWIYFLQLIEAITLVIADKQFNESVARMLEDDFRDSPEVMNEELESKGFWFRFLVRAAQLTAPVQ